ncbi:hypothetical protein ACFQZ8_28560 [Micromonospora azadirachtae]|uniref:Uncharacterized protein n=1 Tax=Micromonospora azadirachtae TaxID=1970735 RepID=A0ABW3AA54_9ACTN
MICQSLAGTVDIGHRALARHRLSLLLVALVRLPAATPDPGRLDSVRRTPGADRSGRRMNCHR